MKSVTPCKDSLNSRTLNADAVCATCNKCLVDSNHFAYVLKMLNDVHARTKKPNILQLILFIIDSGCTKHMTGNLKLLCNFVEKFLGTVCFGNDQFAPILGYGDLVQGNVTINRVYYVEGLNHNLFSVGQFCDADLEVAFRNSTCFVRDLQGNDLLTGLQIYQSPSGIFINQAKYTLEILHQHDADYTGCIDSRKSTSKGIQFLGDKLVSWMLKKHNCTVMSSAEAEHVALSSAIAISCNLVQHSRTKHIDTRYHFIKEQVENAQEVGEGVADEEHDEGIHVAGVVIKGDVSAAHDEVSTADEEPSIPSPTPPTPPPQPSQDIPSTSQT
nr:integrase, catalytic region, zinc finger, CCHC-type, peptidase aspartic, catalytic [Tanacetum cinerariifolium]